MKSHEFAKILGSFANILQQAGAQEAAQNWRGLIPLYEQAGAMTVAQLAKNLAKLKLDTAQNQGAEISDLLAFEPVLLTFATFSAKKATSDDLTFFFKMLKPHSADTIEAFKEAALEKLTQLSSQKQRKASGLNLELVEYYSKLLEDLFGEEPEFPEAFDRLKADRNMKVPEAKALAKKLTHATAQSKKQAYEKIWNSHKSLIISRAKAAATAGRSAA